MAGAPSDYTRGEMDIAEQVSTFNFVMGMTKWGSLAIASLLAFFVLWFCTPAGFMGAAATAVVLLVLGVLLLKDGKEAAAH
jgi:hypothetical protein